MPIASTTDRIAIVGRAPILAQIFQGSMARPAPLVLHLRGGAFTAAVPGACGIAALLAEAGAVVVSAEYPVGRAHPFPDAAESLYALLTHLHDNRAHWAARASRLFVAGEEAGGNLAAALAMMARDRLGPPLAGQILLSPMLDAGMATCSYREAEAGPAGCKWADGWQAYLGTPETATHPYAAPACGSRLAGLAPALVLTAQDDPMKDESLAYAGRMKAAGVTVRTMTLGASGWPDALAAPVACGLPWAARVRDAFADFFATVLPGFVPAPPAAPFPARS